MQHSLLTIAYCRFKCCLWQIFMLEIKVLLFILVFFPYYFQNVSLSDLDPVALCIGYKDKAFTYLIFYSTSNSCLLTLTFNSLTQDDLWHLTPRSEVKSSSYTVVFNEHALFFEITTLCIYNNINTSYVLTLTSKYSLSTVVVKVYEDC